MIIILHSESRPGMLCIFIAIFVLHFECRPGMLYNIYDNYITF